MSQIKRVLVRAKNLLMVALHGVGILTLFVSPHCRAESSAVRFNFPANLKAAIDLNGVSNDGEFADPFFGKFPSQSIRVNLDSRVTRDYVFPHATKDSVSSLGLFRCDASAAALLVPDKMYKPILVDETTAVVAVSSYHYGTARGMAPYNEVVIGILVQKKDLDVPPLQIILDAKKTGLEGIFVLSMPVTTTENSIRGSKIWGLPKTLLPIEIRSNDTGEDLETVLSDLNGQNILTLRIPIQGLRKAASQTNALLSILENKPLRAVSISQGEYLEALNTEVLIGASASPSRISFGESPMAQWLKDLKIEPGPFKTQFGVNLKSLFTLPKELK